MSTSTSIDLSGIRNFELSFLRHPVNSAAHAHASLTNVFGSSIAHTAFFTDIRARNDDNIRSDQAVLQRSIKDTIARMMEADATETDPADHPNIQRFCREAALRVQIGAMGGVGRTVRLNKSYLVDACRDALTNGRDYVYILMDISHLYINPDVPVNFRNWNEQYLRIATPFATAAPPSSAATDITTSAAAAAAATRVGREGFKTPATRRNGQETQSPGSILDVGDDTDEATLILAARKFCQAKTEMGMKIPEVTRLRQPPELKDFTRVNLPRTRGKIDMRISFAPEWPATPVGKQLCDLMNLEYPPPGVILVGKSGCGKTSAIFEAAQEKFCILFTASWHGEDNNLASRSDPGGFDNSFSEGLVSDVSRVIANEDATPAREKCEHLVLVFVVARMLLLWTFIEDAAEKSPLSWLMYQLTQDMHNRTHDMYNSLARRPNKVLRNLKRALELRLDFFFAFDEVQHGYDILKDTRLWTSTSNSNEYRGIACPVIRQLAGSRPLVVAGTALSLLSIKSCKSDIGKSAGTEIIDDFPSVSLVAVKEKLNAILNMEKISFEQSQIWRLEGRGRLLGGFFARLAAAVKTNPDATKQAVFNDTVDQHYSSCREQLVERIWEAFKLGKDEENDKLVHGKRRLPESLDVVATASMIGSPVSISRKRIKVDLLHIGLCSVRAVAKCDEFVLDEYLGREAVLAVAQKKEFMTHSFETMTKLCRPAGGHAMEPLVVSELYAWSERNPKATVLAFLSGVCGKLPEGLPQWIERAQFSVKGGYSKKLGVVKGIKDDVEFIEEAVKIDKRELRNRLLSPTIVKRPDFEAVMEQDGKAHWFLAVSSKLYSTTLNDAYDNDFRSTKPNKFYMKKNGHENGSCLKLRRSWEKTLRGQKDLFGRCLRIHVCLPEVKRPGDDEKRIFVDPEDESIVLYITSQNASNVFRPECLRVLRELGCLQDEEI